MSNTVMITGASSGIGRATAELFHDQGWNVVATMRKPADGEELAKRDNVLVTELDVTDDQSIEAAVTSGISEFGQIDALVNNAGYGAYGPLEAFDAEGVKRQFDTNVIGLIRVIQAVLPSMREQASGTIVNISSIGGQVTFPLGTLYHGSKFAVEGLSEALYYELETIGIRVKIIEPGMTNTDFGGRSFDFRNDDSLEVYQPIVEKLFSGFQAAIEQHGSSEPMQIAEVIYQATTDSSSKLRYAAGIDAKEYLTSRKELDDDAYLANFKAAFGL